jgi:hypothetical protein
VFAKRTTRCSPCKLSSGLCCLFDALNGQPTKVKAKGFKIRSGFGCDALVDATFQEIWHVFKVFMLLLFKSTLMNNEINVFINVSRVFTKIITQGSWSLVSARASRRRSLIENSLSMQAGFQTSSPVRTM